MKKTILFFVLFIAMSLSVFAGYGEDGLGEGGYGEEIAVTTTTTPSSSGGGSSDGGGMITSTMKLNKAINRFLIINANNKLILDGVTHKFKITSINVTSVTVKFSSEPVIVTFKEDVYGYVDLNGNGVENLKIKVYDIRGNSLRMEITYINPVNTTIEYEQDASVKLLNETGTTTSVTTTTIEELEITPPIEEPKKGSWIWILVGVVVVILLIFSLYLYFNRNEKEPEE